MLAIFDLDGTLVNSEKGIVRSMQYALTAYGLGEFDSAVLCSYIGESLFSAFLDLGVAPEDIDNVVAIYRQEYLATGIFEAKVIEGIPEVVQALAASGWTLAVATIKLSDRAEIVLQHVGLAPYFSYVSGTTLDKSRHTKADVISHALTALAVGSAEAVMVGDRHEDIRGAEQFSLRSIGVMWGFGERSEFAGDHVVGVVETPEQLLSTLSSLVNET